MIRLLIKLVIILALGALIFVNGDVAAQPKGALDQVMEATIKSTFRFYNLYAALAIKRNDLSVCNESSDYSRCIDRAENIYDIQNFAKGNCNKFDVGMQRDLCIGVDRGCAVGNETAKDMCNAINRKNAREMSKISYRPDWAFELQPMDETEALAMLGLYNGFRTGRLSSCTGFARGEHSAMISGACEILFTPDYSSADFNRLIDRLVEVYKKKTGSLIKGTFRR